MALTKIQLDAVLSLINTRFLSFTFEALGRRALTDSEVTELTRLGLLRRGTRHMVADPHALGRVIALLPPSVRDRVDYAGLERMVGTLPEQTEIERRSIEYASDHAGQYIQGLRDDMVRGTAAATARSSMSALRKLQEGVATSLTDRKTVGQLKTELFEMFDDRTRDWYRVAQTEVNNAVQNAIYNNIRDESDIGEGQLIFKRPNPDACQHCRRLYLTGDGFTPRIFPMSELADSNFGLKARNWLPTIGSVHPYCQCQLHVVPEGYGFEPMDTVAQEFEFEGKTYKQGELIPSKVHDRLGSLKTKTKKDAILTRTEGL